MKRFLTLFVTVALGAALFVPASAQSAGPGAGGPKPGQGGPGGERHGGGMMMRGKMKEIEARVMAQLNLTAKQKADLKALDEKTAKEMAALRPAPKAGTKPTRPTDAQMEKMRNIMKSHHEAMLKILTKEQQAKYKKLMEAEMKKLKEEREKNGGGRPGGNRPGGSKP